jgi:hypothetical protein
LLHQSSLRGVAPFLVCLLLFLSSSSVRAQQTSTDGEGQAKAKAEGNDRKPSDNAGEQQKSEEQKDEQRKRAEEQLKQQKRQRVFGIVPAFNASYAPNPAPLTSRQKFGLAFRSATDPFTFVLTGVDAGINQLQDDYHGYGQGMAGYSKRFAASYVDTFDGTMLGNAVLPSLFHQDPRYFRKGTGSIMSRIGYAAFSTLRCKGDNGRWQPSFSNILGNVAAGGISNLYYPQEDRGAGLTFQRAFTVTAEGVLGAMILEFWPDVSRKFAHKNKAKN